MILSILAPVPDVGAAACVVTCPTVGFRALHNQKTSGKLGLYLPRRVRMAQVLQESNS